jgi:hypothetical protein
MQWLGIRQAVCRAVTDSIDRKTWQVLGNVERLVAADF